MSDFHKFPILCDLDGVIWLAHQPIAGSVAAVRRMRSWGHRVVFVTNNSAVQVDEQERILGAMGIPAAGDVITSAMAAGYLLAPGDRVLVCAGEGVLEAVQIAGGVIVTHSQADAEPLSVDVVIVGFHRHFDYEILRRAAHCVRLGARLIGTNDDATYPTPQGSIPGGGSILAAVEKASGVTAVVAGKPHGAMAALVQSLVAGVGPNALMVGDRPSTDGRFALALGCRFALIRSGVTTPSMTVSSDPEHFSGSRIDIDTVDLWHVADLLETGTLETWQRMHLPRIL